jgi:hypothetical protein
VLALQWCLYSKDLTLFLFLTKKKLQNAEEKFIFDLNKKVFLSCNSVELGVRNIEYISQIAKIKLK